jgi:hypothetical protein
MGIAYRSEPSLELTVSVWDGPVSAEEWHAHLHRLPGDPGANSTWKQLVDLRFGVGDSRFDALAIQQGIDYMIQQASHFAGMNLAIISGTDHESVRFFGSLAEQANVAVAVFPDLQSACTWLGVDASRAAELIAAARQSMI